MNACSPNVLISGAAADAGAVPPHPANRGGTTYIPRLLAQGFDGLKETFDVVYDGAAWGMLTDAKAAASQLDARGKGMVPVRLGGETLQMHAHGRRGSAFLLSSDHFDVVIRPMDMEWGVSVEYRAAALWAQDAATLKARVSGILAALGKPRSDDAERLSMVHWAMDFYSPDFTGEISAALYEAWVCISKVKKHLHGSIHGAGDRVETMTLGSKSGLQVQVYDKGREVREVSGKEWMADIYARAGHVFEGDICDVWRVELRFGTEWLRNRNIKTLADFERVRRALLHEALSSRRLTRPTGDSNRARWPLHPLWEACTAAADTYVPPVPLGRVVTGKRRDLMDKYEAGIAGYIRTAVILELGCYDEDTLEEVALRAVKRAREDAEAERKAEKAMERLRYVDAAQ